ncbi:hypothetical protein [Planktothrix agardhii]|uniref:hypothetical protein n=1 Tax=Planktothrix agardhii TaxID=1160 RepID=UPI00041236FB|nr:hypothetical protein [Planktothrix agardhii]
MKVRFLLDENLPPKLKLAVQRFNPDIDIIRVGEPEAPHPLVSRFYLEMILGWLCHL